jgi:hypothetical protein
MKYIIYKLNEDNTVGEKLSSYEGPKDETSTYRSHLFCPPHAVHLELPEGVDEDCVLPVFVPASSEQTAIPARWSNGSNTVFDPNDIPTIVDEKGNASLDPNYKYFPAIEYVPALPDHYALVFQPKLVLVKKQKIANEVLQQIRALREPLLKEADVAIFKLEDEKMDSSKMREYRKQLRICTDILKKDNQAKLECAEMIASEFKFPVKP